MGIITGLSLFIALSPSASAVDLVLAKSLQSRVSFRPNMGDTLLEGSVSCRRICKISKILFKLLCHVDNLG